ncbi:MAG: tRNA (adenosine(37)-N6)-dimethylallyltransferase MiaA [Candidatus Omnitrophota bacterium]
MDKNKKSIIFLVGPTAVGKTAVSIALAKRINAEIVSCDSMQIYRGFDVFTAKPAKAELHMVRHYLVDVFSPEKEYNVAIFRRQALLVIGKIYKKNKIPLIVGGSGMYFKVLIDGIFPEVEKDIGLRSRLIALGSQKGTAFLYQKLQDIDPEICRIIQVNDLRRIVRALEVYEITGKKMSELQKQKEPLEKDYNVRIFGLNRNRQNLYKLIDKRVDKMFEQGLVEVVRRLSKNKISISARQALGYKEIVDYLEEKTTLEEANRLIKRNSRHFAKRQLTWFRQDKRIEWIDIDVLSIKEVVDRIIREMTKNRYKL